MTDRISGYRKGRGSVSTLTERFYARLEPRESGCIEWTGCVSGSGYGTVHCHTTGHISTHRLAWKLEHGEIPDGMFVCHACDNRTCCNVAHLFLGTPLDNMRDMIRKGRARPRGRTRRRVA